jgi:hypothetical protein
VSDEDKNRYEFMKRIKSDKVIGAIKFIFNSNIPNLNDSDFEDNPTYIVVSEPFAIITMFAEETQDFWKHDDKVAAEFDGSNLETIQLNKAASLQVGQSKFPNGMSGFRSMV